MTIPGRIHMFKKTTLQTGLTVIGFILIAVNLRPPLTSVGPVSSEIAQSLGLSTGHAGLLTTIPVLTFGLLSGLVSRLSKRFRMEDLLLCSLALLTLGLLMRPGRSNFRLFAGTV